MKHCPNPQCPFARKHGIAAEYREDVQQCSDCGTTLVAGGVDEPAESGASGPVWISKRLLVSIAGIVAAYLATWVIIPGVDPRLVAMAREHGDTENLSIVALGLQPFISAMVLVELAALLVPPWRRLRRSGPAERWKLSRAALALTPVLAFFQGFGVAMYLEGLAVSTWYGYDMPVGWGPRLMTSLTLSGGTFVLLAVAAVVHRFGVGNGLSVLLAGSVAPLAVKAVTATARALDAQEISPVGAFVGVAVLALPALATWRLARANAARTRSRSTASLVRLPASGIVPILSAASLMLFPTTLANLGLPFVDRFMLNPGSTASLVVKSVLVVALCVLFGWLFHLPGNVKRVSETVPGREEMTRAIAASAAYLLSLVLATHLALVLLPPGASLDALSVAIVSAVVLDVLRELRAPAGRVSVWPIHQLYAVQVAVRELRRAKIDFHLRGLHHRTLLQFYGPFVPVEVFVAPDQAERATEILENVGKTGSS